MLWARWPKLAEKLNIEGTCEQVLDIPSNVLDALIQYIYTGKIECKESKLPSEAYAAAVEYGLPSLCSMPVLIQKAQTRISTEKVSFQWPIENFPSLPNNTVLHSPVFTVGFHPSCIWNLIFEMK
ncbi:hypothetical protein X975_16910, partial [Stegodyphus mimosarum]